MEQQYAGIDLGCLTPLKEESLITISIDMRHFYNSHSTPIRGARMVKARMGLNMSKYTLVYMPAHAKILQYVHMRCGQQPPFVDRKPMDFHSSTYFPNIFMFPNGPMGWHSAHPRNTWWKATALKIHHALCGLRRKIPTWPPWPPWWCHSWLRYDTLRLWLT